MDSNSPPQVTQKKQNEEPRKKQYQKPSLRVYGNIEALTATVNLFSSITDGGTGGMTKTH